MTASEGQQPRPESEKLVRGIGLGGATALNMTDMIGVGPFITLPLIIGQMGGPQAMLGWILGAVLAIADGLVWAELGAALPGSGGSYLYLKTIYGPDRLGRLLSFLFIWQLAFSAPLSIASGCIGLSQYATYLNKNLSSPIFSRSYHLAVSHVGSLQGVFSVSRTTFIGVVACLGVAFLLYRRIAVIERLSRLLWVGVMITVGWVIFAGLTHFNPRLAFDFPAGAFGLNRNFFVGLGGALLVAVYDYWGYYNICFIGGEVKRPGYTIPRAVLISTLLVGAIYIVMNVSVLGVIPWRDMAGPDSKDASYVISVFMQRIYGNWAAYAVSLLVMWTALASVFSLMLGYSRVPYAAALDGNFFRVFSRVHPKHKIPSVSLIALAGIAAVFCFFSLAQVVAALVVIRIMLQFLAQIVGVVVLRIKRPDLARPFKMWLYPAPAAIALLGFSFVLVSRVLPRARNAPPGSRFGSTSAHIEVVAALVLLAAGVIVYLVRAMARHEWPFALDTRKASDS